MNKKVAIMAKPEAANTRSPDQWVRHEGGGFKRLTMGFLRRFTGASKQAWRRRDARWLRRFLSSLSLIIERIVNTISRKYGDTEKRLYGG